MRRVFLILFCLLLLTVPVSAAEDKVSSLSASVIVAEDGSCDLTVTAEISFASSPTSFVFPLSEEAGNITASGGQHKIRKIDGVRCVIFSNKAGFTGTQTFICSYSLPVSVVNLEEAQEFTLLLPEKGWEYPIENLHLQLQFPTEVTQYPTWSSAYYEDVVDNYLNVRKGENTLEVFSVSSFQDRETLTMKLQFPPDSFRLRNLPGKATSVSQIIFYVLFGLALLYWFFFLRNKLLLPKTQHTAGMEATAGEIPCQLYGELPDVAATLAHWGNLGYVAIYRNKRGRIILRRQMDMGNERKPSEQKLFHALFRSGNTCDLQSTRFHSIVRSAGASLRAAWTQRMFRKKSGNPTILRGLGVFAAFFTCLNLFDLWLAVGPWRWVLIPLFSVFGAFLCYLVQRACLSLFRSRRILLLTAGGAGIVLLMVFASLAECSGLMLLNLLLQAFCALSTLYGGRRTDIGNDQARQLLGLRKYLKSPDEDVTELLSGRDGQYFFRMLPFAEQLGVGKSFCKHFSACHFEPCPWLSDASHQPCNAREFYTLYCDICSAIREDGRISLPIPAKAGKS